MTTRTAQISPQVYARIGGTLYLLIIIAGLSYLMNSFTLVLAPEYAGMIFLILILALIGELSLCLWLIVKGVDLPKWENRAFESA